MPNVTCYISHRQVNESKAFKGIQIRNTIMDFIKKTHPDFSQNDYISFAEYDKIRKDYLVHLIAMGDEDISAVERAVVNAIAGNKILSENLEPSIDDELTFGQRAVDIIAEFGGSWKFIFIFFGVLFVWISLNVLVLDRHNFDPYPFILLNLILSCLAAIQAPIIMMSQNRLEQKDRQRGENDYKINLKAELEIKLLHEKIDHLSFVQNKRLLEIQQMQIDYLDDILKKMNIEKSSKK